MKNQTLFQPFFPFALVKTLPDFQPQESQLKCGFQTTLCRFIQVGHPKSIHFLSTDKLVEHAQILNYCGRNKDLGTLQQLVKLIKLVKLESQVKIVNLVRVVELNENSEIS